jgi:hypothetical protein
MTPANNPAGWTGGPWSVRTTENTHVAGAHWREVTATSSDAETVVLGEVFESDTGATEAEANARLIAAAPDLYEALKSIAVKAQQLADAKQDQAGFWQACADQACAALAKARGEAA